MRLLNRYLFNSVAGSTFLVLLVLVAISGFLNFVGQLDDVGKGDFTMLNAIQIALLKIPGLTAALMPVSALLGALL
ncbi:MAG: LptF/LptG family permease, partial [Gammaproteobacteria bacterium]